MTTASNNHRISLNEAITMTKAYRNELPNDMPISEAFTLEALQSLLAKPEVGFLRIYFGRKDDQSIHTILVAADKNGNDLLPSSNIDRIEGDDYEILEDGFRCPYTCPEPSPLNS